MSKKKKSKYQGLQKRKAIAGYLFILPFILGFLAFMVKPFIQSIYMSLCKVNVGGGGFGYEFRGLANYIEAFTADVEFSRLLTEELGRMVVNVLAIMVFSFFCILVIEPAVLRTCFCQSGILPSGDFILGCYYRCRV